MKSVTEQHHIEYQFGGLQDDDTDDFDDYESDDDDDDDSFDSNDAGELSFDYAQNDQGRDVPIPTNSMEVCLLYSMETYIGLPYMISNFDHLRKWIQFRRSG